MIAASLLLVVDGGLGQPRSPEDGNATEGADDGAGATTDDNATRGDPRQEMTEWEGLMLPPGVEGEVIHSGLSFPTGIEWDDEENLYVSLVGFSPQGRQILRIDDNGSEPLDLSGADLTEQILDLTFHEGSLYFTSTGRIHVHDLETSETRTIVQDLPAWGDHRTDEIVFGPDGRLYVGQGTVTNSGVIGFDQLGQPNAINNVSGDRPDYHEIPCVDVQLSGWNWETLNPFANATDLNAEEGTGKDVRVVMLENQEDAEATLDDQRRTGGNQSTERDGLWMTWEDAGSERVLTGPFSPFATPTYRGQTIPGEAKCNGAVLSMNPDGSDLRPVAWGFRNPFALKFDTEGQLWVSDNGPDARGSRPLEAGPDTIQIIDVSAANGDIPWYGWPDHTLGYDYTHPFFSPPWGPEVKPVFDEPPSEPITQFTWSAAHASSNKFDFGPPNTTYENSLFLAEFGTLGVGIHLGSLAGMAVARVDMDSGRVTEFITGADRWGGQFRPVEAIFGPDDRLYVLEFGEVRSPRADGNATHGARYSEEFEPQDGRVLAFTLPDEMDWEGLPIGNPGGDGQNPSGGEMGPRYGPDTIVNVFDFGFSGAETVEPGDRVTFRNVGRVGHTATEEHNLFNSGFELAPRTNFTWIPSEEGTYSFYCAVHPSMRGSITVQEETQQDDNGTAPPDNGGAEDDQEDEGVPGFGITAGLVALGAAAVVAGRRRGSLRPRG